MQNYTPSIVENIEHRRFLVTEINKFDVEHGIPASQRAKYDKQNWAFVAGLLVGKDKKETGALTCKGIITKLQPHGLFLTQKAIRSIIQQMKHPAKAIHPHRRGFGQSCLEVVQMMGGIRECTVIESDGVVEYPVQAYYFGANHDEVVRLRRALAPIIQVKP